MKIIGSRRNVWILALTAALAAGCSGADSEPSHPNEPTKPGSNNTDPSPSESATVPPAPPPGPMKGRSLVTGRITNNGKALVNIGLGGSGTLDAAVKIRFSKVLGGGKLELLGDAGIDAEGKFSLDLPLDVDLVIGQVLDASGKVLGGGILGGTGKVDGEARVMAPIDIETSLELAVLLQLGGCDASTVNTAALVRSSIDAKLATELSAALDNGLEAHVALDALVQATLVAGKVKAQIYAKAGVNLDVELLTKLQLDALAKLNAGLDAALLGKTTVADVTAQFLADLDAAARVAASLDANLSAHAEVGASLGFASELAASLSVNVKTNINIQAVLYASVRASALVEARVAANVVLDSIKGSGAPPDVVDAAARASLQLIADIGASVNVDGLNLAKLKFMATINDLNAKLTFNPLGALIGGVFGTLEGLVSASAQVQANIEAQLRLALCASVHVDVNAAVCVGGVGANASAALDFQAAALVEALATLSANIGAMASTPGGAATLQIGTAANATQPTTPAPAPLCPPDGGGSGGAGGSGGSGGSGATGGTGGGDGHPGGG